MADAPDTAARVIERLVRDGAFRAEFLRDPPAACRAEGLDGVAQELEDMADDSALETLDLRESRSSLGWVFLVAAMEGIGLVELSERILPRLEHLPAEVADVLSRVDLPAIADEAQAASGDPGAADDPPPAGPPEPVAVVADEQAPGYSEDVAEPAPEGEPPPVAVDAGGSGVVPNPEQYGVAGTGGPVSPEAQAVLDSDDVILDADGTRDFQQGRIDPRVASILLDVAREHQITVSSTSSDHGALTSGGSVSNHHLGRGLDIAAIDGVPVNPSSAGAREVAGRLAALPESYRPTEVGAPWQLDAPGFFTDGDHQDHLHVGFDDPISPDWRGPPDVEAPIAERAVSPERRYDSLLGPSVGEERHDAVVAERTFDSTGYPGDDASHVEYARWMAAEAVKRDLPPELPVMAALVESGLENLPGGDRDSAGFFQMRDQFWNKGAYAGYADRPELQLDWFLDHAEEVRQDRIAARQSVTDEAGYGEWVADVEDCAAEYRYRYQLRLAEAQELLEQAGG